MASSLTVNSAPKVTSIDDNTLKVVIYKGKPPHKRFTVKKSSNPSLYKHYFQWVSESTNYQQSNASGADSRKSPRQHFRGAPGKY